MKNIKITTTKIIITTIPTTTIIIITTLPTTTIIIITTILIKINDNGNNNNHMSHVRNKRSYSDNS